MSDFGEIRVVLHQEQGEETWQVLGEMLSEFPDGEELEEVALPYCQRILARAWPEGVNFWSHEVTSTSREALLGGGQRAMRAPTMSAHETGLPHVDR